VRNHAKAAGIDATAAAAVDLQIPAGHERGEVLSLGQRIFYRFWWVVSQLIARGYFRLRIRGARNVPRNGPFILAPTHRSNLDSPMVALVGRRQMRYMGKESLWKKPAGGWFLTALGGFPVKRGNADREALRACEVVLRRGEPLVVFPEGTRQSGPALCELFDGPAYLACRTGVPIVPVGIGGTERAMGKGVKLPRPVATRIIVGAPLPPPEGAGVEGVRVPRREVRALTERLAAELQRLMDEANAELGLPTSVSEARGA
jgi:1-acyl-sn-glycerol-3-phosphate acyltransferase